ncbi:glycoside hydrolase family 32 protein [Frondihabitans sucicola]|uniref:glycoside hydrolase family 32 protein n=1 Tax=Frondihabitans sucicola TaxID=1268041 RepID=UPI0033066853
MDAPSGRDLARTGGFDRDGCWSGNTVVDDDGDVVAFYSAYDAGSPYQSVVRARSRDGGDSFEPARAAFADPAPEENVRTFRDPFVWRDDSGWRMVVGTGMTGEIAGLRAYSSPDLETWTYDGLLLQLARTRTPHDTGAMWECPQILTLDGTDIALVSTWTEEDGIMQVLSTTLDGGAPRFDRVDHGTNFYAASVLRAGPFGPVVWGWATEGRDRSWCLEDDWSGMLTLPRLASLRPDGSVGYRPPLGSRTSAARRPPRRRATTRSPGDSSIGTPGSPSTWPRNEMAARVP